MKVYSFLKLILTNVALSNIQESERVLNNMPQVQHCSAYYVPDLYSNILSQNVDHVIPLHHVMTRFHYEYLYNSRFSDTFSYANYCLFEEKIASIMRAYLLDTRDTCTMFVFEDYNWLWSESVFSYFSEQEQASIQRILIADLDVNPSIQVLPDVDKKVFVWNIFQHDRI